MVHFLPFSFYLFSSLSIRVDSFEEFICSCEKKISKIEQPTILHSFMLVHSYSLPQSSALNLRFYPKWFASLLILQKETDDSKGQGSEEVDMRRKKVEAFKVWTKNGFLREN